MRFTIVRDELVKSVNVAFRAISNKVSYPVLENLKLDFAKLVTYLEVQQCHIAKNVIIA